MLFAFVPLPAAAAGRSKHPASSTASDDGSGCGGGGGGVVAEAAALGDCASASSAGYDGSSGSAVAATLVSGGLDQTLRLWAVDGDTPGPTGVLPAPGGVRALAATRDGRMIAAALAGGAVAVLDMLTRSQAVLLEAPATGSASEAPGGCRGSISFDASGALLAAAAGGASAARLFRADDGWRHTGDVPAPPGCWPLAALAFSPLAGGPLALSGGSSVCLWDVASGSESSRVGPLPGAAGAIAFSEDGRLLAVASAGGTVQVWELAPSSGSGGGGSRGGSGGGAPASTTAPTCVGQVFSPEPVTALAFAPAGRLLAAACQDGACRLYADLAQRWQEAAVLRGDGTPLRGVAFSADGRRLATAAAGRAVYVWAVAEAIKA